MHASYFARKRNRLPRYCYRGRQWYFITACTGLGHAHFSSGPLVGLLLDLLRTQCSSCSFNIYAYCFMPNHVHLELVGLSDNSDVIALLHDFKGNATSQVRTLSIRSLWEKGFYDHVRRDDDDHNAVAWYIFNNPVRKGLVDV
ncbi:MAG TPA: transposase [Terriglobia bacterium]|nr:transposase [Terriglobia bacterium]